MQTQCPKCNALFELSVNADSLWTVCPECVAPVLLPKKERPVFVAPMEKETLSGKPEDVTALIEDEIFDPNSEEDQLLKKKLKGKKRKDSVKSMVFLAVLSLRLFAGFFLRLEFYYRFL